MQTLRAGLLSVAERWQSIAEAYPQITVDKAHPEAVSLPEIQHELRRGTVQWIAAPERVWRVLGLSAWVTLILVTILFSLRGREGTVLASYRFGAEAWQMGDSLYGEYGYGFLYLPHAAILYIPFERMGVTAGGACWRVLNLGMLAWGLWALSRHLPKPNLSFSLLTLATIPICLSANQHGQSTLAMGGCFLLAVSSLFVERYRTAAIWLTAAVLIKPLMLVPLCIGLFAVRPLREPLLASLAAAAALPLLFGSPGYVGSQYAEFVAVVATAGEQSHSRIWAQAFTLLSTTGIALSPGAERAIGLCVLALMAWRIRKGWHKLDPHERDNESNFAIDHRRLEWSLSYVMVMALYLTVFNPRAEANTYALLGPAAGLLGCLRPKTIPLVTAIVVGLVANYELGHAFGFAHPSVVTNPLMGLALMGVWLGSVAQKCESGILATADPLPGQPFQHDANSLAA